MRKLSAIVAALWLWNCSGRPARLPGQEFSSRNPEEQAMLEEQGEIIYPVAALRCGERNEEDFCIYRLHVDEMPVWDASPSDPGPDSPIDEFRRLEVAPNVYLHGFNTNNGAVVDRSLGHYTTVLRGAPFRITNEEYGFPEGFLGRLQVWAYSNGNEDFKTRTGETWFYTIVTQ